MSMISTPSSTTAAIALDRLRSAQIATVLTPGDLAYPAALAGYNLREQHRPDLVVVARSSEEIAHTVRIAAELDLHVSVFGRGHGMPRAIDGGIAVTTEQLSRVSVDPVARTATVGAGSQWQHVLDVATPHGLAPLNGSSPLVGVIGYLLGGGIGPVARTYGFAADHVRSFEVVTGAGDIVRADPEQNEWLYWALRGGKRGFGIVTEAVIDLFPIATVFAGGLFFAAEHARPVLQTFAEWSASLPEQVTASVAVLRLPPLPELPEQLRGRTVLHVRASVVTDDAALAARAIEPMRAVAPRLIDTFREIPYAAIASVHQDPTEPMPFVEGGTLLSCFDSEAVDAFLAAAGPEADVPLAMIEVRRLGGALGRTPAHPNAVSGRDAEYSVFAIGAPVPELMPVLPQIIGGVLGALEPWTTGTFQANFVGPANSPTDYDNCWTPETRARLDEVRWTYDPEGLFS